MPHNKVREEVEKIHPCKTPCIIKLKAESNGPYADWIGKEAEDDLCVKI